MRLALDAQTRHARRLLASWRRAVGADLVARDPRRRRRTTEAEIAAQRERGRRRSATALGRDRTATARRRPPAARPDRRAHAPGRVDHRRRRLGLRHRLRRPRPRPVAPAATSTSSCSTPRSTPTPAARPRRRRRAARSPSSPRRARPRGKKDLGAIARAYGNVYVAQIAIGANDAADDQGAARGRRVARAVAGDRLLDLHRPRHRHGDVDEPPEGRRQVRLLAAVPLPARARPSDGTRSSSTARSRSIPIAEFVATEARFAMLARTDPERAAAAAPAGAGRCRRALALLQQLGRSSAPSPTSPTGPDGDTDDRQRGGA